MIPRRDPCAPRRQCSVPERKARAAHPATGAAANSKLGGPLAVAILRPNPRLEGASDVPIPDPARLAGPPAPSPLAGAGGPTPAGFLQAFARGRRLRRAGQCGPRALRRGG
ncbi:hypothetical protein CG51_00260 [Haematobacter missouriensis]|nr:hypothetical protein CG51_00260 [Haematobacter missouriensis]